MNNPYRCDELAQYKGWFGYKRVKALLKGYPRDRVLEMLATVGLESDPRVYTEAAGFSSRRICALGFGVRCRLTIALGYLAGARHFVMPERYAERTHYHTSEFWQNMFATLEKMGCHFEFEGM